MTQTTPSRDIRQRLERFAANPACEANRLAVVHDLPMERAARDLFGLDPIVGQSPFAIARGVTFERELFAKEAASLMAELKRAGALPEGASGFLDLRLRASGGPMRDLDEAAERFARCIRELGNETDAGPSLVAGAALELVGRPLLPDGMLVLDALTIHREPHRVRLRVGEIKVYPDRGGNTDRGALASARAQAGLYLHALGLFLRERGVDNVEVDGTGFLVLMRAGSNRPSVRANEDFRHQARRAERAYEMLRAVADEARPRGRTPALRVLQDAEKHYGERCISFCELADHCSDAAVDAGVGESLGSDVARFLGNTSVHRALELAAGATAADDVERDLVRRIGELGGIR